VAVSKAAKVVVSKAAVVVSKVAVSKAAKAVAARGSSSFSNCPLFKGAGFFLFDIRDAYCLG